MVVTPFDGRADACGGGRGCFGRECTHGTGIDASGFLGNVNNVAGTLRTIAESDGNPVRTRSMHGIFCQVVAAVVRFFVRAPDVPRSLWMAEGNVKEPGCAGR